MASRRRTVAVTLDEKTAEDILSGINNYNDYLAAVYFKNLMANTSASSPVAYQICNAIEGNIGLWDGLSEKFPAKRLKQPEKRYPPRNRPLRDSVDPKDWKTLNEYFDKVVAEFGPNPQESIVYKNLRLLGEQLQLSKVETDVLQFLYAASQHYPISGFMEDFISGESARIIPAIARMVGQSKNVQKIATMLDPSGSFATYGLLNLPDSEDHSEGDHIPSIAENILGLLHVPHMQADNVVDLLIGKPMTSDLDIKDFPYLSKDIAEVIKIIRKAIKNKATGINIMLHGPSGSGKTALAGAIAKSLGLNLYAVGEEQNNEEGAPSAGSTAKHRLGKLFQAHAFLKDTDKALLLFDEVEDILMKGNDSEKSSDSLSKIVTNRLLEKNGIVTIWACNDKEKFHESMRQRFSFSIHIDYPPVPMRVKIWDRQLDMHKARLTDSEILQLARQYKAPPRMIANAVKMAVEDGKIDIEEVQQIMNASARVTYGSPRAIKSTMSVPDKFNLEFLNYEQKHQNELATLIAAGPSTVPYAILMQGPKGSGLKTFGRYMAERAMMGQQETDVAALVSENSMSSSESRITEAFESAGDAGRLLILSNLDELAEDPEREDGWKSELTSFFMAKMAAHPLPIIAHSFNKKVQFPVMLTDTFSLHIKVNPLSDEQCRKAHETYFGHEPGEELKYPRNLVISDFTAVSKIIRRTTNGHTEPSRLITLLGRQASYRQQDERKMGF